MPRFAMLTVVSLMLVLAISGCGGGVDVPSDIHAAPTPSKGAAPWPAPSDPLELTRRAGLKPERHEFFAYHVHAHLDVFVNGEQEPVPAAIGININDPGVHQGPLPDGSIGYGGISLCAKPCISPLHTHDDFGVIHTESARESPNRLGEFFTEWGVRLDRKCVGGYCRPAASILVYVNGDRYTDDPAAIPLTDRKEIAIVIGTPPEKIPTKFPS